MSKNKLNKNKTIFGQKVSHLYIMLSFRFLFSFLLGATSPSSFRTQNSCPEEGGEFEVERLGGLPLAARLEMFTERKNVTTGVATRACRKMRGAPSRDTHTQNKYLHRNFSGLIRGLR